MTPKPVIIGLLLCDRAIVDKDMNSPSSIGIFTGLAVDGFPSEAQRFSVLTVLIDAQGGGMRKMAVNRLDDHCIGQEEISPFKVPKRQVFPGFLVGSAPRPHHAVLEITKNPRNLPIRHLERGG